MIGLILATCIAAHDCTWDIIEAKQEWETVDQCELDIRSTLRELNFVPAKNQDVWCDELKEPSGEEGINAGNH